MKWLTNTYDPERNDAKYSLPVRISETREYAWQKHLAYLADKHIGEPKATVNYTVDELKQMGYVGVYAVDES